MSKIVNVGNIACGSDQLFLISGPCVIETEDVMLRTAEGEPMSHYLSIDLVFKTAAANEKKTKEHLPLLRSLAVRALSSYTLDKASRMNIDQVARDLNLAFARSYAESRIEKPFSEAMIGKLIIE